MKSKSNVAMLFLMLCMIVLFSCEPSPTTLSQKIELKEGWNLQASSKASGGGSEISSSSYNTANWYKASVPSTVMGVLVENGLYPDIFKGTNIKHVDKEQFNQSWWYRKTFELNKPGKEQFIQLNFDGISYYANIWLNGKQLASKDSIFGSFRTFSFDITRMVNDGTNVLAVEVFRQQPGDFGIGYADWNPRPPDENMGLWRNVYVKTTGAVEIAHPTVESDVDTETLREASLVVKTELTNHADYPVKGTLNGRIDSIAFEYKVELGPHQKKNITLTESDVPALHMKDPRLWWCAGLGDPNLYHLELKFTQDSEVSDQLSTRFGIREVKDYYTEKNYRGFMLNGKKVLIKGAGWTDDIFLRDTRASNETQIQYVKHMNLNTIRLESFWGSGQSIYELCDQYGIMVMVGWSCQWEWDSYLGKACGEFGGIETDDEMELVSSSLRDQVLWLRNHPSIITWFVGSDKLPKPPLEEEYKKILSKNGDRPYLAAAANLKSTVSGPTGVKMNGPYEYEGPAYWYIDSIHGGAYGFNTETGPGPQIPVKESIMKMIPGDKLWPINETWNFHCTKSTEAFNKLDNFNAAMEGRYGPAKDLDNYVLKAGVTQYEAIRPMFEAFRINQPNTTGIIQWMLNSAWPSFYWQLYDYYQIPTTAYYAVKKANEPLQLVYNYGNEKVYSINESYAEHKGLKAKIQVFDIHSKIIKEKEVAIDMPAYGSGEVLKLDPFNGVVFLSLQLLDAQNILVASNFYWLSDKPDVFAWDKTTWAFTPMKSYADFSALNSLAKQTVDVSYEMSAGEAGTTTLSVTLTNGKTMAFFNRLAIIDQDGAMIHPAFWDDNYFALLPGETKTITCKLPKIPDGATLDLSGWNVEPKQLTIK